EPERAAVGEPAAELPAGREVEPVEGHPQEDVGLVAAVVGRPEGDRGAPVPQPVPLALGDVLDEGEPVVRAEVEAAEAELGAEVGPVGLALGRLERRRQARERRPLRDGEVLEPLVERLGGDVERARDLEAVPPRTWSARGMSWTGAVAQT